MLLAAAFAASTLSALAPGARAWALPIVLAHLKSNPSGGLPGTMVTLKGKGFTPDAEVTISFIDANGTRTVDGVQADAKGRFAEPACVPWNAVPGTDTFYAESAGNSAEGFASYAVLRPPTTYPRPRAAGIRLGGISAGSPDSICV